MRLHAPHLVDAEVGNVLRRHKSSERVSAREAATALAATHALIRYRYPHAGPLSEIAWTYRANLSFYDALYVALAVQLSVPLVTADTRLGRAPKLPCALDIV